MSRESIICPYCFETFRHDEVLFRAETCYTEDDILDDYDIDMMPDGEEKMRARETNELKKAFLAGVHPRYQEFWERYNGTTEQTRRSASRSLGQGIENYQKPVINPRDPRMVRFNAPGGNGVELDKDGFLSSVIDIMGNHTSSRVCPRCCNPLPHNYGKFPVKFISVIGITGAGKTVYLSSLLDNMYDYADKIGMTPLPSESVNFFIELNKIARDVVLPQGTSPERMSQPLCYNLQYFHQGKGIRETSTFVIYDIAGENCVNPQGITNFGKFISHSDGIIILQDPKQFKDIYGEAHTMTQSVLNTIISLFVGKRYCDIPMALCISKCDRLISDGLLGSGLIDMLSSEVKSAEDFRGFCAKDYNNISKEIDAFYHDHDNPTRTALKNSFDNFNYFAVSSLNCRLEESSEISSIDGEKILMPAEKPHPMRIEEPLFWLFTQFGFIKSDIPIINHAVVGRVERLNHDKKLFMEELQRLESKRIIMPPTKKKINECKASIDEINRLIRELTSY